MENASLRQRTKNAIERLDAIEQSITQVIAAVNQSLGNMNQQISGAVEVLDAAVQLLGVEAVQTQVVQNRRDRLKEEADRQAAQVEELKKQGLIVAADKVGEKSLLVGREFGKPTEVTDEQGQTQTKPGEVIWPGRSQLRFAQIAKEIGEKMLGQPVGFQVDTPQGGKWEILEIYEIVEKKPEDTPAPAADAGAQPAPSNGASGTETPATEPATAAPSASAPTDTSTDSATTQPAPTEAQ